MNTDQERMIDARELMNDVSDISGDILQEGEEGLSKSSLDLRTEAEDFKNEVAEDVMVQDESRKQVLGDLNVKMDKAKSEVEAEMQNAESAVAVDSDAAIDAAKFGWENMTRVADIAARDLKEERGHLNIAQTRLAELEREFRSMVLREVRALSKDVEKQQREGRDRMQKTKNAAVKEEADLVKSVTEFKKELDAHVRKVEAEQARNGRELTKAYKKALEPVETKMMVNENKLGGGLSRAERYLKKFLSKLDGKIHSQVTKLVTRRSRRRRPSCPRRRKPSPTRRRR